MLEFHEGGYNQTKGMRFKQFNLEEKLNIMFGRKKRVNEEKIFGNFELFAR